MVQQKPTQRCKAIVLQQKAIINNFLKTVLQCITECPQQVSKCLHVFCFKLVKENQGQRTIIYNWSMTEGRIKANLQGYSSTHKDRNVLPHIM